MMRKYLILLCSVLALAACSEDNSLTETNTGMTKQAVVNFTISSEGAMKETRALDAENEAKIYDCTVLTFDKDGNITGKGYGAVDDEDQASDRFNMSIGLSTNEGKEYEAYAIANTGNSQLFDGIQTLAQLKELFMTINTPEDLQNGRMTINNIALTTKGQLMVTDEPTEVEVTDGVVPFSLKLHSQGTKINVTVNADQGDAINGFRLTGYQLCSVPLSGYLLQPYVEANLSTAYDAPGSKYGDFEAVKVTGAPTVLKFSYYMNENHQGERMGDYAVNDVKQRIQKNAPSKATYVLIHLSKDGKAGTYRYYLGNLTENITQSKFNYYNLLRGNDYNVTIELNDIDTTDPRFSWDK